MSDKFEDWWKNEWPYTPGNHHFNIKRIAREAWNAAIESTVVKKERFGCHCHYSITLPISNYCALDDNDDKDHCHHASRLYDQGKTKADCPYWKPICLDTM